MKLEMVVAAHVVIIHERNNKGIGGLSLAATEIKITPLLIFFSSFRCMIENFLFLLLLLNYPLPVKYYSQSQQEKCVEIIILRGFHYYVS